MSSQVATEVSMILSDNTILRAENEKMRSTNDILRSEIADLRSQLIETRASRDEWMMKATEVQTLLESMSGSLIDGINRMRASRRHRQEKTLGVGDKADMPVFVSAAVDEGKALHAVNRNHPLIDKIAEEVIGLESKPRNMAPRDKTEDWDMRPRDSEHRKVRVENQSATLHPTIGATVRTDIVDKRLPPIEDARLPKPRIIEEGEDAIKQLSDIANRVTPIARA